MSSNQTNEIKNNIEVWNNMRNTHAALPLLTSGYGFKISHSEYLIWKNNQPTRLHCYFGIEDLNMQFYLVDNVTDQNESYQLSHNLISKSLIQELNSSNENTEVSFEPYQLTNQLGAVESGKRIMQWILSAGSWLNHEISSTPPNDPTKGVPRIITIPFSDLDDLFAIHSADVFALLALKQFEIGNDQKYSLEIILTHIENILSPTPTNVKVYEDVTQPHPPFTLSSDFHLLT